MNRPDDRPQPRIAVLAPGSADGELGGAERLFRGLTSALRDTGAAVDMLAIENDESHFDAIKRSYLRFYDLDLSGYDGVISSKAPSFAVRHPNHVCYLMHTIRVFYDMFDHEFPQAQEGHRAQRALVHRLDTACLADGRLRARLAIGQEVAQRLQAFNGLGAEVINHPSTLVGLHEGPFDHFFLPGRLHRWKRVDLAIRAFRATQIQRPLVISGEGEDEAWFRNLAGDDPRIRFVGRLTEAELADYYARALAVIFVPRREDMGLVTFEAFLSGKPVLTAADSGEPANIVRDGETGLVCAPDPDVMAACMTAFDRDPAQAQRMGAQGRDSIAHVTWLNVARKLMSALGYPAHATQTAGK